MGGQLANIAGAGPVHIANMDTAMINEINSSSSVQAAIMTATGNKGYFATAAALALAYPTGAAGEWAIIGATDTVWTWDTGTAAWVDTALAAAATADALQITINGQGFPIVTGEKGDVIVPFNSVITGYDVYADVSGSISIELWKDTYANYPPTVADKITASAPIAISSAVKAQDSTLTGWTTTLGRGDVIRLNVVSAATITRCTVFIKITRTV